MTELAGHLIHDHGYLRVAHVAGHVDSPALAQRGMDIPGEIAIAGSGHLAHSVSLTQGDSGSPAELGARADSPPGSDVPGQRPAADSPEGART